MKQRIEIKKARCLLCFDALPVNPSTHSLAQPICLFLVIVLFKMIKTRFLIMVFTPFGLFPSVVALLPDVKMVLKNPFLAQVFVGSETDFLCVTDTKKSIISCCEDGCCFNFGIGMLLKGKFMAI